MKNVAVKFKAFIASLLVAITFISPYYPQKMDVTVEPITAGTQQVVLTFENNTNRNVVSVPDKFVFEAKTETGWEEVDGAAITDGFKSLKSAQNDTLTVDFGTALAAGQYSMSFTFKTTNGWLTSGRTFTTTYNFTVE